MRIEREPSSWEMNKLSWEAQERYDHLRDRGMSPERAFRVAEAWDRNITEQRARRLSHGTGAT